MSPVKTFGSDWQAHIDELLKAEIEQIQKRAQRAMELEQREMEAERVRKSVEKLEKAKQQFKAEFPEPAKEIKMNIGEELINQLTQEIQSRFQIPVEDMKAFISKELEQRKPKSIVIKKKGLPPIHFKEVHANFEKLLNLMACRLPVFITGPAGSGKTKAVEQASEALSVEFSAVSVGPQTTQAHLMGYMDAVGKYVPTEFRKRFEHGGVFLIDEFDAGSPQVLTCLNSALSGNFCAFPDGMVKKHENFLCVATGNTYGNGANRIYVGRNQLDGATIDRFVYLEWDYCPRLEKALSDGCDAWYERVKAVRKKAIDLGLRVIISPRATIYGATLIKAGVAQKDIEDMVLFKGLSKEDRNRIQ